MGQNFVSSTYGYGNCKVFAMFYSNIWKVNFEKKNTCMALSINIFPFLLLSTVGKKQISPTFSYFLINNALLYHFLANWLAHNKKMTEKSVFFVRLWVLKWCHNCSQCPVLGLTVLYCTGSDLTLLVHQNMGKENRYRKICFAILISTWGRFNWANKKNLSYAPSSCFVMSCICNFRLWDIKGEGHSKKRIFLSSPIKSLYWVKLLTEISASKVHSIARNLSPKKRGSAAAILKQMLSGQVGLGR